MKRLYKYIIAGAVYFAMLTQEEAVLLQNRLGKNYIVEEV